MKVLKFGAVWCSGCLVMRPRWRSIEQKNPWLKTKNYDYDQDRQMVKKYGIEGGKLPVFVFLDKKGRQFLKLSGEISEKELEKTVLAHKNK